MVKGAHRGTPQGGVPSPLLWNLVVEYLIKRFERKAPKITAYADDISGSVFIDTQLDYGINAQDSKLTWKPNVLERVKKATIALYASKKMLSSTWGLSPALMHWVYISVVRPTLMYGVLVCWQAMEKPTYNKLMEGTQRQALLWITGALRSTLTITLETIIGVDPLDIHAQMIAGKAAQRLVASGNMSLQGLGHSSIGRDMSGRSDYMVTRTCPDVRTTTFMGPDDWKTCQHHAQHLNIYTDGSKMEEGVGAGIYCTDPDMRLSYKLPSQCSIFHAEVFAIGKAAELAQSIDPPHEAVNLFEDSQAAIRSMQSSAVSSKSVLASREALDIPSTTTSVRIYWVPSHQGREGRTGKTGRHTSQKQMEKNFHHLQSFKNHVQRAQRNTQPLRAASSKERLQTVGILTGHCLAAAHAVKLGITDNAKCRKCDEFEAIETLEHLICKCPALTRARINYLGAPVLASLEDASRKKPGELLAFAKNTTILKDFENRENIL
ncbi:uncharacterized protein LOC122624985 [Drosophila teissieri]|uniref:uncharacterized protein LOC122624985 n=1 Tax=Drosophila teissieri TaxID=7243 RepID=UPI001CBA597B|nr:uncharacterized protein LOC122624985 [Drosophila teissieri]